MQISFKYRIWLGVCLLTALSLIPGIVLAHEGREAGEYRLNVGWAVEPAYEGALNGVEVRVTEIVEADPHHSMTMPQDSHGHMSDTVEADSEMSVSISLEPDADAGANLTVETSGFRFAPEKANQQHVTGEGHAHVFVNGAEAGMIYAPEFHLSRLAAGMNEVRVVLNANSHETYSWQGQLVEASATIHIEEEQGGPGYGEPSTAGESHAVAPVEGLEGRLQVEVTHRASGVSRVLALRADIYEPGRYAADLIPTAPGIYEFRVLGAIEGNRVDEVFVSKGGGGGFDDVQTAAALQFPDERIELRELESAVRGAIETARQAEDAALAAESGRGGLILGVIGIALGAGGLVVALAALLVANRRRAPGEPN